MYGLKVGKVQATLERQTLCRMIGAGIWWSEVLGGQFICEPHATLEQYVLGADLLDTITGVVSQLMSCTATTHNNFHASIDPHRLGLGDHSWGRTFLEPCSTLGPP